MALKHKNLNELFTAICDEVRRLSGRPSDMAIDFLPYYIRDNMLGRFIVNDTNSPITFTASSHSGYLDTAYGIKLAYLPDGGITLTAKGGTSSSYEYVGFRIADGSSDNITITTSTTDTSTVGGKTKIVYGAILQGFTRGQKYKIEISTAISGNYDTIYLDLLITSVPKHSTNEINFTVGGITFSALDNMTWSDFISSSYENGNYFDTDGINVTYYSDSFGTVNIIDQQLTSLLVDGTNYSIAGDGSISTVNIIDSNISTYFDITNGSSYYFAGNGGFFEANNTGLDNTTATTVLTAKYDMDITFSYSYVSESKYDKFTLKAKDTIVENAVSGDIGEAVKTYSGSMKAGDKIEFTYAKDSSQSVEGEQCSFFGMVIAYMVE